MYCVMCIQLYTGTYVLCNVYTAVYSYMCNVYTVYVNCTAYTIIHYMYFTYEYVLCTPLPDHSTGQVGSGKEKTRVFFI